jgi:hypothetical protein
MCLVDNSIFDCYDVLLVMKVSQKTYVALFDLVQTDDTYKSSSNYIGMIWLQISGFCIKCYVIHNRYKTRDDLFIIIIIILLLLVNITLVVYAGVDINWYND